MPGSDHHPYHGPGDPTTQRVNPYPAPTEQFESVEHVQRNALSPSPAPSHPHMYPPRSTSGAAVASFICSITAFFTVIGALAGVILGHIALRQIKRTGQEGKGLAIAGLVIGYFILLIILVAFLGLFAIALLFSAPGSSVWGG